MVFGIFNIVLISVLYGSYLYMFIFVLVYVEIYKNVLVFICFSLVLFKSMSYSGNFLKIDFF